MVPKITATKYLLLGAITSAFTAVMLITYLPEPIVTKWDFNGNPRSYLDHVGLTQLGLMPTFFWGVCSFIFRFWRPRLFIRQWISYQTGSIGLLFSVVLVVLGYVNAGMAPSHIITWLPLMLVPWIMTQSLWGAYYEKEAPIEDMDAFINTNRFAKFVFRTPFMFLFLCLAAAAMLGFAL